jgi:hypothetical protein
MADPIKNWLQNQAQETKLAEAYGFAFGWMACVILIVLMIAGIQMLDRKLRHPDPSHFENPIY